MEASGGIGGEEGGVGGEESEALVKELVFDGFDSQLGPPTNTQNHTYTHRHRPSYTSFTHAGTKTHTFEVSDESLLPNYAEKLTYTHKYGHRDTHTHIHIYTHTHTHVGTHVHTHTHTHTCGHAHACTCTHTP